MLGKKIKQGRNLREKKKKLIIIKKGEEEESGEG